MKNDVTIVRNGVIYSGEATSMHDENGNEVLIMKVDRKGRETKVVKREHKRTTVRTLKTEPRESHHNARRIVCKNATVEFNSLSEAAKMLYPDRDKGSMVSAISACCSGRAKSVHGLQFEYVQ